MELYIHIPFCASKCVYCAFDSFPGCGESEIQKYLHDIIREASLRKKEISESIVTAFIGGGTPSLIPASLFDEFIKDLRNHIDLSSISEFTAEANPGTVTKDWLNAAVRNGINRISFGMQAAQDDLLKTLGRIHRYPDVTHSVTLARSAGFQNINLDLIFGIPGQTMNSWTETIEKALILNPEHISAYGLIPEPGTPLAHMLETGQLSLPDVDLERDMYDKAITLLADAGFQQYEISNFARKGYECIHNIGYWDQIPYLGLGLSAASMIYPDVPSEECRYIRRTNPHSFEAYRSLLRNPENSFATEERISEREARFETVMLSLRMNKGMNRRRFRELHRHDPEFYYGDILNRLEKLELIILDNDSWKLTRRGMDIQNSILLEFME